jgi:hypothetical protein
MQRSVRRYALLPFAFVVSALACHGTSEPEPTSEWTSIAGKLISVTSNSQTGESRLLLGDLETTAAVTSASRVELLVTPGVSLFFARQGDIPRQGAIDQFVGGSRVTATIFTKIEGTTPQQFGVISVVSEQ